MATNADFLPHELTPVIYDLLSQTIRKELEDWIHSGNSLSMFVTGKTGSGKSALVNALVGRRVAIEGAEPDPMTTEVQCYRETLQGIRLSVWDSPGLHDGTVNEQHYIASIQANCADVDLRLFCINVSDAVKFNTDSPDAKALVKLSEALGPSMWDHAVIALTFSNRLGQKNEEMRRTRDRLDSYRKKLQLRPKDKECEQKVEEYEEQFKELFCSKIREWDAKLREMLGRVIGLKSSQVERVKIVPTGFRDPKGLPDSSHWLSTFWFSVLGSMRKQAQPALIRMNGNRIVEYPDAVDKSNEKKHLEDQELIFQEYGRDIGRKYGIEDIGSLVGLTVAKLEECQLTDRLILEQFLIIHVLPTVPPQREEGTQDDTENLPISPSMCTGSDTKGF